MEAGGLWMPETFGSVCWLSPDGMLWRRPRTNAEGTPVMQHSRQDATVVVSGGRSLS
jgi:hypothetical protein